MELEASVTTEIDMLRPVFFVGCQSDIRYRATLQLPGSDGITQSILRCNNCASSSAAAAASK